MWRENSDLQRPRWLSSTIYSTITWKHALYSIQMTWDIWEKKHSIIYRTYIWRGLTWDEVASASFIKKGLQTDSSSTVSRLKWKQILSFQKTTQYIYGLQNSSLREIRLIDMWYSNLSNNFFSYLNNTSLERIFFDNNRIIASNIGDVLSPLSKHLREISLKAT